jgi:hypothetical protein
LHSLCLTARAPLSISVRVINNNGRRHPEIKGLLLVTGTFNGGGAYG